MVLDVIALFCIYFSIMKNLHFLLFVALTLFSSCHKDDDPIAPIDELPPATQTGAGTFACLVNGEPFIDNSGSFNCFYQLVNGKYYFGIGGDDDELDLFGITLGTYNKEITEDETYILLEAIDGNTWGGVYINLVQLEVCPPIQTKNLLVN